MPTVIIATVLLAGGVWPQFRGPSGQGQVDGSLPLTWSETDQVAWSCRLPGKGHSSPAVWDKTAWLTTSAHDGTTMSLVGVDVSTGELVHETLLFESDDIHEIHHGNSYATPTPCIDETRVYAHFGRYGTAAVDTNTGEVLWRNTSINVTHQSGPASSPVLAGGRLILVFDAMEESFVCGLDPATGEVDWKTPRSAPLRESRIMHRAFSTPLVLRRDGRELIVVPGPDQLNCYDAATGEELWHTRYVGFSTVPAPAATDEQLFFCTGFYDPELVAVSLEGVFDTPALGDVTASHEQWRYGGAVPNTSSPVVASDRVWIVSDKGVLTSVDKASGVRRSVGRVRDNVSASPLVTSDGRLYVFGESGVTTVWDITDEKPKQLSKNDLGEVIKATPAVVDGDLLIRTSLRLVRVSQD